MSHHQSLLTVLRNRHVPKPISNVVLREARGWLDRGHHIPHRRQCKRRRRYHAVGVHRVIVTHPPLASTLVHNRPRVDRRDSGHLCNPYAILDAGTYCIAPAAIALSASWMRSANPRCSPTSRRAPQTVPTPRAAPHPTDTSPKESPCASVLPSPTLARLARPNDPTDPYLPLQLRSRLPAPWRRTPRPAPKTPMRGCSQQAPSPQRTEADPRECASPSATPMITNDSTPVRRCLSSPPPLSQRGGERHG
eukprot:1760945-Prymnesium_polylepis.1